jgi:TRAP-type C4-dicarboxylate transport system substrate-binding protein
MVQKGIADVGWVSTTYEPGRMTVASAATLPFLTANAVAGSAAYDEWYRPHAGKDMPGVRLCLMHMHEVGTLHARSKEIRTPDQLAGLRVRSPGQVIGRWASKLGSTVVQVSAPESREALERGIVDAIMFPYDSLYVFGLDKTVKYHTDANIYVGAFAVIVNPASYDALSPAQKAVIDGKCNTENAKLYAKQWSEREREGYRKISTDPAHTMVRLKPEELSAWRRAAEVAYQDWKELAKQAGWDGEALLASLRAALEKHGALEQ